VVVCTNREGLYEALESIQDRLSLCEKALAEYLETKRLAFPRFYFVSSADLLDILSIGNEPEKAIKHLSKLFDSLAKLKLDEEKPKTALGMQAKDGENVAFPSPCDLSGQVEVWLQRVLNTQINTVLYWLAEAVQAYEEKSREQWIMEFPGQVKQNNTIQL
jgi:dynein heavy chain